MSSTPSPPKRFRIERLEERNTPGMMFWADDLGVNALTQWAVIEASDSPAQVSQLVARNTALNPVKSNDSTPSVVATPERSEFPAWAEQILLQIERELSCQTPPDRVAPGITDGVTFFSDFMHTSRRSEEKDDYFPVWAQELLADLNQRPADGTPSQSATESSVGQSEDPRDEGCDFIQPKCETGRFPAWAEQLLSAVDRRIDHDSRLDAAEGNRTSKSQRLRELIDRRLASTRVLEAQVGG